MGYDRQSSGPPFAPW